MKKRWLCFLCFGVITFLLPFGIVFSQEVSDQASTDAPEEIFPSYLYDYIPDVTFEQVNARIKGMNTEMPFELNDRIFSFIQYYTVRNRDYTKMVLSRKDKYFPLFEETLRKHEMPSEIEYLSIVESALDPKAKSRVGAMGLWQFMPATGKMYGMNASSEIDDRMDPDQSTVAAAKYLKSLYRMFGDWEMALAAYNCGPGNVRKAIRRSGGKKTFWEIYNHLPRETRGYVPQFQAMLYIFNHLEEHNLNLEEPTYPIEYEHIRFDRAFSLEKLAELTLLCIKDLEDLNPSVKNRTIPESHRFMAVRIPKSKSLFLKENLARISDSLGNDIQASTLASTLQVEESKPEPKQTNTPSRIAYKVKSGDALGVIASKHGVTITQIKNWNNLSGNLIRVGQTLYIHSGKTEGTGGNSQRNLAENSGGLNPKTYTVKPGDSLWIISQKHSLSIEQIKRLNNLNTNQIKPGQRLIVG